MSVKTNTKTNKNSILPKKDYSKQISDYNKAIAEAENSLENMQAEVDLKTRQIEELETAVGELEEIVSDELYLMDIRWNLGNMIFEWMSKEYLYVADEGIPYMIQAYNNYYEKNEDVIVQINDKIIKLRSEIDYLKTNITVANGIINGLTSKISYLQRMEG